MWQSLADTFFELSMVVNPQFAVGISMLSLVISEIYVFPFSAAISGCRLLLESPRDTFFELGVVRSHYVCRLTCDNICHTFGAISTSGLDGHIAISGRRSYSESVAVV